MSTSPTSDIEFHDKWETSFPQPHQLKLNRGGRLSPIMQRLVEEKLLEWNERYFDPSYEKRELKRIEAEAIDSVDGEINAYKIDSILNFAEDSLRSALLEL